MQRPGKGRYEGGLTMTRGRCIWHVASLLLALLLFSALAAPTQSTTNGQPQRKTEEVTVYVTKTGKKYHRESCRSLSKSKIPISLKDAKAKGYTPCKVCKPPE